MLMFLILIWLSFDKLGQFGWKKEKKVCINSTGNDISDQKAWRAQDLKWEEEKKSKAVFEALILIWSDYGVRKLSMHTSAIS